MHALDLLSLALALCTAGHAVVGLRVLLSAGGRESYRSVRYRAIADLLELRGDVNGAHNYEKAALRSFRRLNNRTDTELASFLYKRALRSHHERHLATAKRLYREALSIWQAYGDFEKLGSVYHQLGVIAHDKRSYKEAERLYEMALNVHVRHQNLLPAASTLHQLGVLEFTRGKCPQARKHFGAALELFSANAYSLAGPTLHQLALLAEGQKQDEVAERYHLEALAIFDEILSNASSLEDREIRGCVDRLSQAGSYQRMGEIRERQQRLREAEEFYLKALKIFDETNDDVARSNCWKKLGKLAGRQGNPIIQVRCLERAAALLTKWK